MLRGGTVGVATGDPGVDVPRTTCCWSGRVSQGPCRRRRSSTPLYGNMIAMKATIDNVGRLVIPRPLRECIGLAGGGTVEIDIDGAELRVRPVASGRLREEGELLLIARSGQAIDDADVRKLIDADRYRH